MAQELIFRVLLATIYTNDEKRKEIKELNQEI
jgi:hypothetical protein